MVRSQRDVHVSTTDNRARPPWVRSDIIADLGTELEVVEVSNCKKKNGRQAMSAESGGDGLSYKDFLL